MLEARIVDLHADVLTASECGCCAGASAPCEWIEYGLSLKSEATDQGHQREYGLLRGMELIAAVGHLHHIAEWLFRKGRPALG